MRHWLLLLLFVSTASLAQPEGLLALDAKTLAARQSADMRAIATYRDGLARVLDFVRARPSLFPAQRIAKRLLTETEKVQVRSTWKSMLDYQLALEALERFHGQFYRLRGKAARGRSLLADYAAHVARYRFALEFLERAENDGELAKVLNEPVAELGLEAGSYDRFKLHFLNVGLGAQFAALSALHASATPPRMMRWRG